MAKKKPKKVDLKSQKTITIVVPDAIADLDKRVLEGIGKAVLDASSTFDVTQVAIVKTSRVGAGPQEDGGPTWARLI
jgi:hypothetical protein